MTTKTILRPATLARPVRAVLYVRMSADHKIGTAQEGAGVERQEKLGRKLADAKEWAVVDVFSDNDKSASNGKERPEFERLLKEIEAGRIDAIIVWHLDRLARKMGDLLRIIEVGAPVKLNISAVQGTSLDMSDPTGIAVAQILTAIAGMEVAHKGQRQRAANAQRATAGKSNLSGRAYGLNPDGTPREAEAFYVRKIFEMFAAGAPITELTKYLTDEGQHGASQRTRAVEPGWSRTGVRSVLKNRKYLGEVIYLGEVMADNGHGIIEPDLFAAVQARLSDPTRMTTTSPARKHLGAGVYCCGICGGPMASGGGVRTDKRTGRVGDERQYKCPGHMARLAANIDKTVKFKVAAYLDADLSVKGSLTDTKDHAEGRALRDEAAALRRQIDEFGRKNAKGILTDRQCQLNTRDAQKRIEQIEEQLAERGRRSALDEVRNSAHPGLTWLEMDIWRQTEVLAEVAVVTLLPVARGRTKFVPESVQIDWKR